MRLQDFCGLLLKQSGDTLERRADHNLRADDLTVAPMRALLVLVWTDGGSL